MIPSQLTKKNRNWDIVLSNITQLFSFSINFLSFMHLSDICMCICAQSLKSCLSLWPYGWQPARLLCAWDSPSKNTGVGCHPLLQEIFPTQGSNPCLISSALADKFFTASATWEADVCVCVHIHMHSHSVVSNCLWPDSTVHGILQVRILEWVAISFSSIYTYIHNFLRLTVIILMPESKRRFSFCLWDKNMLYIKIISQVYLYDK